ncbi:hypothetical protein [Mycobacterium sp. ITM-2016-00318]|uniref:hypothetical protein n=1 Tax=Mycobacterium sp. ITM-2016-00318 TaxID=2099693 RepID=UPI000CF8E670|nr:hypothetical protein [Mycobacterium sp. ITM-2016-00318]WNG91344.1 hypothetical protein C6A82_017850 [Mycobacterium sp. ITM-2016-00318]
MHKALRPYMTAGVAVVGASALAIAPVIAAPPDVKILNPAAQQSAGSLDAYVESVRQALENLEALLGSALALPAPTGWTLELALDNLFNDPGGSVPLFVDDLEALGPLAGASVPALLENAADAVQQAVEHAAEGNIDLAIASLIRTYVTLAPAVTAMVGAPLNVLDPDAAKVATVVLAKSLNAAAGPVLSAVGSTGVAMQNVVDALNDAKPGSNAFPCTLIAAPGTVLDGVLNGFTGAPDTMTFPGLLTPGDPFDPTKSDPGPVSLAVGLARGFASVLAPQPESTIFRGPDARRVVTLEVNAGRAPLVAEAKQLDGDDPNGLRDLAKGTNKNVMAAQVVAKHSSTDTHRPRLFGGNPVDRSAGSTGGLSALREGFRDGVRDAVKTVAGRNRDAADAGAPAGDEPVGP